MYHTAAVTLLAWLLLATAAQAQTLRFYIVPKAGSGVSLQDAIRPKYIGALGVVYGAMDYGLEDTFLVGAQVTSGQHTTIAANADVIVIPQNLDASVGANLATVQARLESLRIPSDWVTSTHTYRQIVGAVGRLFLYMQRFHGRQLRRFFEVGVTLDTQVNALTVTQRNAMTDAAASLGLDVSGIGGPMSIRQALRILLQQLPAFTLGGETF